MNEPDTELSWLIASSTDSQKLALKITGIIVGLSSTIVLVGASLFHIQLAANDVVQIGTELGMVAGAIAFVTGVIRHIVIKLGTVQK